MKEEVKNKWVAALRSGDYEQCRGYLRKADKFCAIGVLCDVVDPKVWNKNGFGCFEYMGSSTGLNHNLAKELGFSQDVEDFEGRHFHPYINGVAVSHINDQQAKTFEQIADLIEANWEKM